MYTIQLVHSPESIWGVRLTASSIFIIIGITTICAGCFINWQINSENNFKLQNRVNLINNKISKQNATRVQYILFGFGTLILLIFDFILIPFNLLIIYFCTSIFNKTSEEPTFNNLFFISLIVFSKGMVHNLFLLKYSISISLIIILIPFILLIGIISFLHQQSKDMKLSKFNLINLLILILCVISCLLGISLNDPISSTASLTIIPFLMMTFLRNYEVDLFRAVRYSILAMFLFSVYPQFIWVSIILYFISKYYYWHRFDFHYPKLVLENDRNFSK